MLHLARLVAAGTWVVACAACAACAARPAVTHEPAAPDELAREGRAKYRALPPPATSGNAAEVSAATLTPAYASPENALPVFPDFALRAGCDGGVFRARVFVGADGNVTGSEDLAASEPQAWGRCPAALRGAVHAAVSRWRFAPSFRVRPRARPPAADGGPSPPGWEQTPVPVFLDFEFTFEVVDGQPAVRLH